MPGYRIFEDYIKNFVWKNDKLGIWVPSETGYKIDFIFNDVELQKGRFQLRNLHKFKKDNQWGLINSLGEIIVPAKYLYIELENNLRSIQTLYKVEYAKNQFGYIDNLGNEYF